MNVIKFPKTRNKKLQRYCFVMDDGQRLHVIARDFRAACRLFDQFHRDPQEISHIECHEPHAQHNG